MYINARESLGKEADILIIDTFLLFRSKKNCESIQGLLTDKKFILL